MWGGQGYPNKHHEHFKVIFSITREEIQLPVKIGDKNLNLTRPTAGKAQDEIVGPGHDKIVARRKDIYLTILLIAVKEMP